MKSCRTTQIQACLDRLAGGDDAARDELVEMGCGRLRAIAHNMLRRDRVRRWEQTDDVLQEAIYRIHRELASVQLASVRDFLRFSAFHIQREITRLARHYFGPHGWGANYHSDPARNGSRHGAASLAAIDMAPVTDAMQQAEQMTELYAAVDNLPDELREVVEVLWIHGFSQAEAGMVLSISERTVRRRWARARLALGQLLGECTD